MDKTATPTRSTAVLSPESPSGPLSVSDLANLEQLIIGYLNKIERHQKESRKFSEMLGDILNNNEDYKQASTTAKEAAKAKAKVKQTLLNDPEARDLNEKVKEFRSEVRQLKDTLVTYLTQYAQNAATLQFEDQDGQVREIVYVPKVVKRGAASRA